MNVRSLLTAAFAAGAVALRARSNRRSSPASIPPTFDKSVRPQDDLFRYVNGTWLAKTRDPSGSAPSTARSSSCPTRPRPISTR